MPESQWEVKKEDAQRFADENSKCLFGVLEKICIFVDLLNWKIIVEFFWDVGFVGRVLILRNDLLWDERQIGIQRGTGIFQIDGGHVSKGVFGNGE